MDKVYIYKQENYNLEEIKIIIKKIFSQSGFEQELTKGKKAFLKANLLRSSHPENAVTTHPIFVRGVVDVLVERGVEVIVGDSPAGPFNTAMLKKIYRDCGLTKALEDSGGRLNFDTRSEIIKSEESLMIKDFEIFSVLKEVDLIINLPKLKTHTMMTYTGAVKNMFGAIVGLTKANYHFRLQNVDSFGKHLIDIYERIKPQFNLMDGIVGMEGDGPSGGDPISSNIIMGAYNAHALDKVAIDFMKIEERKVPTVRLARERNLFDEIEIIGDEVEKMEFKLPKGTTPITFLPKNLPPALSKFIVNRIKPNIIFDHDKCIKCRDCSRSCPAKIIYFNEENYPYYDKSKCISCFCCHEVCPVKAIDVKKPLISRFLRR